MSKGYQNRDRGHCHHNVGHVHQLVVETKCDRSASGYGNRSPSLYEYHWGMVRLAWGLKLRHRAWLLLHFGRKTKTHESHVLADKVRIVNYHIGRLVRLLETRLWALESLRKES